MDQQTQHNSVRQGVNAVMGVKTTVQDTTIATDREHPVWDKGVTVKYLGATLVQIGALAGLLWMMDLAFHSYAESLSTTVQTAIACLFFTVVTLRSRLFSLLDNTRSSGRYTTVQRPSWAPPPLTFPIVWMSIAVLRVVSAYLVWSAMGQTFLCLPLVLYMIHLSLGDTWNTIFTVEGRLGAAVPMVIVGPLLSAGVVTASYYQTLPLAGWVIVPSFVWLAIATVLCISIWKLNGQEPLYPLVAKG
jgi:tryptophan-rich sensory protein